MLSTILQIITTIEDAQYLLWLIDSCQPCFYRLFATLPAKHIPKFNQRSLVLIPFARTLGLSRKAFHRSANPDLRKLLYDPFVKRGNVTMLGTREGAKKRVAKIAVLRSRAKITVTYCPLVLC